MDEVENCTSRIVGLLVWLVKVVVPLYGQDKRTFTYCSTYSHTHGGTRTTSSLVEDLSLLWNRQVSAKFSRGLQPLVTVRKSGELLKPSLLQKWEQIRVKCGWTKGGLRCWPPSSQLWLFRKDDTPQ